MQHRRLWFASAFAVAAVVAGSMAVGVNASSHGGGTSPGPWCGGTLWRLMTLSDQDRQHVRLDRIETSIPGIAALIPPKTIGARRSTGYELNSWRIRAVVDRYRIASNGEIVLVLFDIPSGKYMDAYLTNPHCLGPGARDRTGILAARQVFTGHCPHATAQWQLLGASVDISGIGYWNPVRTTRGALPSGAELRPVTNLQIVSGCGIASK